jgi:hypothetical protein
MPWEVFLVQKMFEKRSQTSMSGHHLILGELTDLITGKILEDTLDERYRQKLARLLIFEKAYHKSEVEPRHILQVAAGNKNATAPIDFLIHLSGRIGMLIKFGPGSLVTRRRPTLAASRLVAAYQVPVAVVTNGEDAEVLDASNGTVIACGLESIPDRQRLLGIISVASFGPIPFKRREMEARIFFAYEVDGCCPCDDSICRL